MVRPISTRTTSHCHYKLDILTNSTFDENAVNRERDVILREAEEVAKQYEETILDHLHETAFGYSGLGRTILGIPMNLYSMTIC